MLNYHRPNVNTRSIKANVTEKVERIESKCRYMVDAHAKASALWTLAHYSFSIPLVIFSAVIGLAAFKKLFENNETVIGVLAITVSVLSTLITFLNPYEKSRNHHNASIEYDALKDKAHHIRTVEVIRLSSVQEISSMESDLITLKHELDKRSPAVMKLSPKAIAVMKRLRELIYGASGKKQRSRRKRRSR